MTGRMGTLVHPLSSQGLQSFLKKYQAAFLVSLAICLAASMAAFAWMPQVRFLQSSHDIFAKNQTLYRANLVLYQKLFVPLRLLFFKICSPDSARDGSAGVFFVKVQIIYDIDEQLVSYLLNIPKYFSYKVKGKCWMICAA